MQRLSRVAWFLLVAAVAAVAAVVALSFVTTTGDVGPGRMELRGRYGGDGHTQLEFPPLGRVEASTHGGPLVVRARVAELDVEELQTLLDEGEPDDALRAQVESAIRPLVREYAIRVLLVALITGALVGALAPRRRVASAWVGAVAAVVAVGAVLGVTWRGFDPRAFDEPRFHGALARAPQIIDAVQRHVEDVGEIRSRVEVLGSQISALYAAASSDALPPRGGDVRILHVSDIHSNPLGLEIARDLARQFDVDAILDTGDLTSFGYPVEARMGDLIREIRRPYLYVPGNHDSDANRAALDAVPNVELLDGDTTVVGGIEILGVGDPTFTATNEIDSDEAAEIRLGEAPAVAALVAREQPDVLAVHDTRVAGDSYGTVPVIVAGHRHRSKVEERDGTLVLTVGSTGATGLGAFLVKEGQPYEARLLHFRAGRLAAIDTFRLQGLSGSYDIQRRTFEPPEAGERPGPDGGEGEPEEDVSATNPR